MRRRPVFAHGVALLLVSLASAPHLARGEAAEPDRARTLDELLERARTDLGTERRAARLREERFAQERDVQQARLADARAALEAARARNDALQAVYDRQADATAALEADLQERAGELGELFGTVRQSAAELVGTFKESLVSAQVANRAGVALALADSKELPSIPQLEEFWRAILDEMVATGEVESFTTTIVTRDGAEEEAEVVRVGAFDAVSNGRFLRYLPETGRLFELSRQPAGRFQALAQALQDARAGDRVDMALDPSRGSILSLMTRAPTLFERVQQGRWIGGLILLLGFVGLGIGLERVVVLTRVVRRVRAQEAALDTPSEENPLGRLLAVFAAHAGEEPEGLVLRLEEQTQKEIPQLQRGLSTIAVLATTAPLLGLLGTVTGMIATFQSIAMFGTGDPRLMSGGISEALVTTALGLCVAIPLSLLHTFVSSQSGRVMQVLDERSTKLVADDVSRAVRAS